VEKECLRELNKMGTKRNVVLIALTATLFGFAACAHAHVMQTSTVSTAAVSLTAGSADPSVRLGAAQAQISAAVRALEQATLQWDFSSNASELALLQQAREDLGAAAKQLDGIRRVQTDQLLADLDHAIRRTATELGPLHSNTGDTFGPPPPSRNQLAQLTTEGQDLERGVPFAHRLLDTVDSGSTSRHVSLGRTQMAQAEIGLANKDLQSWPPDEQVNWPQVHFRF
jgi:hypothetical protein